MGVAPDRRGAPGRGGILVDKGASRALCGEQGGAEAQPHPDAQGSLHLEELSQEGGQQRGLSCTHGTHDSQQAALGHSKCDPGNMERDMCPWAGPG